MRETTAPCRTSAERAFTLVEVIVVVLIVAVMIAAMVMTRRPGGTSSTRLGAIASARSIGAAVDDFRKDHGGRPPVLGAAAEWPTGTLALRNRGPINAYTRRPYTRKGSIEGLSAKYAHIVPENTGAPAGVRWALEYYRSGARPGGWVIVVRDQQAEVAPCYLRGGAHALPAGVTRPC